MLTATNLSVRRGEQIILRDLTIQIAPGKIVALLGRNGAGKSTLLKALSGEISTARHHAAVRMDGTIMLNAMPVNAMSPKELALARAVLPQSVQFAFPFTGREIVMFGRYPHGGGDSITNRKIAMEALALADATALTDRDVTTLSGGELARVQFGRVLAQLQLERLSSSQIAAKSLTAPQSHVPPSPARYLLLDEPTAALDLAHQHLMLTTLRRLASEWNIGVLAIMHDPNLAARYADQLAWLANGTLLAQDAPYITMTPSNFKACLGIEVEVIKHAGKPPYAMACDA
ncbi:ATP-binding cassette domain-containing protein [Glaciimonas immobilis]|uniref:Iron complex transport system ATP-binding protein n=1 Tax=Glaciimonas immobilis TaxID=728004 RepID=A0A840RTJ1_9BURK|nr:ATP-binding cassette domain-containing protein [Glaciimonas immobilis]KAF3996951.1 ATP-binding cassette domain-containing protein [Glaciimonas immobilis]MBB5199779.1 iron complex transport system ATP-binding protein [Glaciimonas immobilis]